MTNRRELVRGIIACKGRAVGVARVVFRPSEIGVFNHGDVLVARTTDPSYTRLMLKASGIVTDFGGVTCHAAIVARELGVPCMVGASTATQAVRDGANVLLDCEEGVLYELF